MKKDNKFLIFCLIAGVCLLMLSIIRSFNSGITYDEAYTYINYVKPFSIGSFKYFVEPGAWANNHFLNTFLIFIFDNVSKLNYSEFIIRLPNLLSYVIYIYFSYKLSKKYKNKYLIFSIFAFNYSMNEYASLGRGYCLAASFITAALYFYKCWNEQPNNFKNLNYTYVFLALALFSNTISLLVFAAIFIDNCIRIIKHKTLKKYFKKNWCFVIIIFILVCLNTNYHFLISSEGLPLYGSNESFIESVFISGINEYGILINPIIVLLLLIACVLLIIIVNMKKHKEILQSMSRISIFLLLLVFFTTYIFDKPWITGRVLIPLLPIFIFSFSELLYYVKNNKTVKYISICISVFLIANFIKNCDIIYYRFWRNDHEAKVVATKVLNNEMKKSEKEYIGKNKDFLPLIFYRNKFLENKEIDIFDKKEDMNYEKK